MRPLNDRQQRVLAAIVERDRDGIAVDASYLAGLLRIPRDIVLADLELLLRRLLIVGLPDEPSAVRPTDDGRRASSAN